MTPIFRYGLVVLAVVGSAGAAFFSTTHTSASADVASALVTGKVTSVSRDNAGMNVAMRMGHDSLPEMFRLLEQDMDVPLAASVKLRFEADGQAEYIWAQLSGQTETGWVATLQSAPLLVTGDVGKGSQVRVDPDQVVDWSFQSERTSYRGNFTECYLALQEKLPQFVARVNSLPGTCDWAEAYRKQHASLAEQIPQ